MNTSKTIFQPFSFLAKYYILQVILFFIISCNSETTINVKKGKSHIDTLINKKMNKNLSVTRVEYKEINREKWLNRVTVYNNNKIIDEIEGIRVFQGKLILYDAVTDSIYFSLYKNLDSFLIYVNGLYSDQYCTIYSLNSNTKTRILAKYSYFIFDLKDRTICFFSDKRHKSTFFENEDLLCEVRKCNLKGEIIKNIKIPFYYLSSLHELDSLTKDNKEVVKSIIEKFSLKKLNIRN